MRARRSIAAAGVAIVLGTAGALLPAVASAHTATATLKFTATQTKSVDFTLPAGAEQYTDTDSQGKVTGFSTMYIPQDDTALNFRVEAAFAVDGGFLYATFTSTDFGSNFKGEVTGGTGKFNGATGTITAIAKGFNYDITIDYS
jgi:hypothetical protein